MSFSEQKYKTFEPVYSCKYFRILHKNSAKQSLDISISRKHFKLAVNRNKIKRRMVGIKLGAYNDEIKHIKLGPAQAIYYSAHEVYYVSI